MLKPEQTLHGGSACYVTGMVIRSLHFQLLPPLLFGCFRVVWLWCTLPISKTLFQLQWPRAWEEVGITAKGLFPIVLAAALWGRTWCKDHVYYYFITIIQNWHAKQPILNHLLCCLYFYSSVFQFHFSALNIPGVLNVAADAISHNNLAFLSFLIPRLPK